MQSIWVYICEEKGMFRCFCLFSKPPFHIRCDFVSCIDRAKFVLQESQTTSLVVQDCLIKIRRRFSLLIVAIYQQGQIQESKIALVKSCWSVFDALNWTNPAIVAGPRPALSVKNRFFAFLFKFSFGFTLIY